MKSLKQRLKKHEISTSGTEWSKYDERLLRAVESGDTEKVSATLKKGAVPTRLDAEGCSAFHLAASKGLINSLNIFLSHGVNLHAVDASGKTALHLSAGGGHSACVQRLLQCKSPVDSTDLQGRTALHDAAYAGHSTIIKMLCDSGASVSAIDTDGRSPLLLAAQMSHPRACQHLLLSGASTSLRDKQNKTALILACEHRSRDVVEVLLKNRADVTAVDLYGHSPYHYARQSDDQALITMLKQALEAANKAQEAAKNAQKIQQQRSMNAEAQTYKRKPSAHSPVKSPTSGISWSSAGAGKLEHAREPGSCPADGKDEPHSHLDSAQVRHVGPHPGASAAVAHPHRPVELQAGESEAWRRELWETRRRLEAAEGEVLRLDAALGMRAREYEELRRSSERALKEAHGRAWELEEALGEVQRRMAGSEARVRQMQAHLVAVRENLVEELRLQLHEARAHREAALTELERAREELGRSRREVEEQRERSGTLQQEVGKLTEELLSKDEHTKCLKASLAVLEARRAQMASKIVQTPSDMTELTSEILQQEMAKRNYISLEEHTKAMKAAVEAKRSKLTSQNTQTPSEWTPTSQIATITNLTSKEIDKRNYISREEHTKALKATMAAVESKKTKLTSHNTQTPSEWTPTSLKATMTDLTSEILQQEMDKSNYIIREEHTKALKASIAAVESKKTKLTSENTQTPSEWTPTSLKATMTDLTSEILQQEMDKKNYISLKEHNSLSSSLSAALQQAEGRVQEALLKQRQSEEESHSLLLELQEQKTELDTLQEALKARFVPVALLEEKERELARLKMAVKDMEESKGTVKTEGQQEEVCHPEGAQKSQTGLKQASQHRKDPPVSGTQEVKSKKPSKTTTEVKKRILPHSSEEQKKQDAECVVEAEGQRETQGSSSAASSSSRPLQTESTTLQAHINSLQQQLEDSEKRYRRVLEIYRTRLLNAAQGHMDEEARAALLQIAQMRQECVY